MIEISNAGHQAGEGGKNICDNIKDIFKDKMKREFEHKYKGWQTGIVVKSQFFVEFKDSTFNPKLFTIKM